MGRTNLTHLERLALVVAGQPQRLWPQLAEVAQPGPPQPYQYLLPPHAGRHALLGGTWPLRWAVAEAETLAARTGGPVLVCRVLGHQSWY